MAEQGVHGSQIFQLNPHERMSVQECLEYSARNHADLQDVIVVGYDEDGRICIRSSHMTRAEAAFMLLAALDHARGL
jgi:hypothetical protein